MKNFSSSATEVLADDQLLPVHRRQRGEHEEARQGAAGAGDPPQHVRFHLTSGAF